MSFRLSRLALRDLGDDEDYVAFELGDIDGARKAIHRFYAAFERVGRRPLMARPRPDLGPEIRSVPVGKHIVLFRPSSDGVVILRIVWAGRDLSRLAVD